jgi:hypothetical protein
MVSPPDIIVRPSSTSFFCPPDRLPACFGRHHNQVFAHAHAVEDMRDLKRAHQAVAAQSMGRPTGDVGTIEQDAPAVGPHETGDDIEQSRLAGAVGADQAGDAAFRYFETAIVDSVNAAERFTHMVDPDHGAALAQCCDGENANHAVRLTPKRAPPYRRIAPVGRLLLHQRCRHLLGGFLLWLGVCRRPHELPTDLPLQLDLHRELPLARAVVP